MVNEVIEHRLGSLGENQVDIQENQEEIRASQLQLQDALQVGFGRVQTGFHYYLVSLCLNLPSTILNIFCFYLIFWMYCWVRRRVIMKREFLILRFIHILSFSIANLQEFLPRRFC